MKASQLSLLYLLALLVATVPQFAYAGIETTKCFYMVGYSYGAILSSVNSLDDPRKIANFKNIFNIGRLAEELQSELKSPSFQLSLQPKELEKIDAALSTLGGLPQNALSSSEIKQQIQLVDETLTPHLDKGDRFSYLVTIGTYSSMLSYFTQPIIFPKVAEIWNDIAANAAHFNMPETFRASAIALSSLLGQVEAADSTQSSKLQVEIQNMAFSIHNLLKNKELQLMSR